MRKILNFWPFLLAILGGSIFVLGFSPYEYAAAALISPAILLWVLAGQSPKKAFWLGLCYGLAQFGFGINWVYVSIHEYGNTAPLLAGFITAVFVFILALFPAVLSYLLQLSSRLLPVSSRLLPVSSRAQRGISDTNKCLLVFPSLWVLLEILRGFLFTGFPWLYVGYAHIHNPLQAFAPIGSVWLVSWVSLLLSGLIYLALTHYRNVFYWAMIGGVCALAFGLKQIPWTTATTQKLDVALVQGNIPQLMRWDPHAIENIMDTYVNLSNTVMEEVDLMIWPEGAIPLPLPHSLPFFERMGRLAKAHDLALIVGVPSELPGRQNYYNSLIGVGQAHGIYHKSLLVPFGEYVPLEKLLRGIIGFFNIPMSSFISAEKDQPPLLANDCRIAPAICYEIAYPNFVQKHSQDADIILTVSNDTWFGSSIGPAQHLQIAQFRALENQKYVLRATNTGLTAIIEPNGSIQTIATQFEPEVLLGNVTVMKGQTFWNRFGLWPLLVFLVSVLVLALIPRRL